MLWSRYHPRPVILSVSEARGFSTIEMLIVLSIAVLFLAATMAALPSLMQSFQEGQTKFKMEKIAEALDKYALINFRVPCAAQNNLAAANPPFGYEQGSGAAGAGIPLTCPPGSFEGIVPFKTLGLPQNMAIDGWGRYFRYAVSADFAQDSRQNLLIHPVCRTEAWMYDAGYNISTPDNNAATQDIVFENRHPRKARFCCPQPGTFLIIIDDAGNTVLEQARSSEANGYAAANVMMTRETGDATLGNPAIQATYRALPAVPLPTNSNRDVVYAIISHGANGLGAPTPASAGQMGAPVAGSPEEENADNDVTFRDQWSISRVAATGYDDIVLWKTQDMLMADQGETCSTP